VRRVVAALNGKESPQTAAQRRTVLEQGQFEVQGTEELGLEDTLTLVEPATIGGRFAANSVSPKVRPLEMTDDMTDAMRGHAGDRTVDPVVTARLIMDYLVTPKKPSSRARRRSGSMGTWRALRGSAKPMGRRSTCLARAHRARSARRRRVSHDTCHATVLRSRA